MVYLLDRKIIGVFDLQHTGCTGATGSAHRAAGTELQPELRSAHKPVHGFVCTDIVLREQGRHPWYSTWTPEPSCMSFTQDSPSLSSHSLPSFCFYHHPPILRAQPSSLQCSPLSSAPSVSRFPLLLSSVPTLTSCLLTLSQFFQSRILRCWESAAILGSPDRKVRGGCCSSSLCLGGKSGGSNPKGHPVSKIQASASSPQHSSEAATPSTCGCCTPRNCGSCPHSNSS